MKRSRSSLVKAITVTTGRSRFRMRSAGTCSLRALHLVRAWSILLSWHTLLAAFCESILQYGPVHLLMPSSCRGFLSQPLQEHAYHRISRRLGYPSPEARWWSSLWATFFLPLGLFIAAWTSYSHIPFIAPLVSPGSAPRRRLVDAIMATDRICLFRLWLVSCRGPCSERD
jgi:hypothetical protein